MEGIIQRMYIKEDSDDTVNYEGLLFLENKFSEYLEERVKDRFQDTEWTNELIAKAKEALADTGFDSKNIDEIFSNGENESNWRIGECLAECMLEDQFSANFPYNNSRDAKNPNGNDTGADLVGLSEKNGEVIFLFGEVKTSTDKSTPPNVLYGKSGMIYQLEKLRDEAEKRNLLVKWIWGKATAGAKDSEFYKKCAEALSNYYRENKLKLVGVLVRDTPVTKYDLYNRAKSLNRDIPEGIDIDLLTIYSGYSMENDGWIIALNRSDE